MNIRNLVMTVLLLCVYSLAISQVTKAINVSPFNKVKFEGSAQWVLIPSDEPHVEIISNNEDVIDYITVNQNNDILTISTTDKNKDITKLFKSVTINVYFKSINSVVLSGVGSVKMQNKFSTDDFSAELKGTGNMHLDTDCESFEGKIHGTGILTVNGSCKEGIIRVEGVGGFEGYNFVTMDMDVTVSGVGSAKVNATHKLTATINGVGSIKYKGDPTSKNFNTNGIGTIKKVTD
jgi:putative autotransporter adhesin-like protein